MAFHHELRRGLTASEATLVITGLCDRYDSLSTYEHDLFVDMAEHEAMYGNNYSSISTSNSKVMILEKLLLDEIHIACEHIRARNNEVSPPQLVTVIKIFNENTIDNRIQDIEMTKESIDIWIEKSATKDSIFFNSRGIRLLQSQVDNLSNCIGGPPPPKEIIIDGIFTGKENQQKTITELKEKLARGGKASAKYKEHEGIIKEALILYLDSPKDKRFTLDDVAEYISIKITSKTGSNFDEPSQNQVITWKKQFLKSNRKSIYK